MNIINLPTKKIVEVKINEEEAIMSLSMANIDYFQKTYKTGFYKELEKAEKGDITVIYKLICSIIRSKKTGKVLGDKFFNQFDEMSILQHLQPSLIELINGNTPEAKDEDEKK